MADAPVIAGLSPEQSAAVRRHLPNCHGSQFEFEIERAINATSRGVRESVIRSLVRYLCWQKTHSFRHHSPATVREALAALAAVGVKVSQRQATALLAESLRRVAVPSRRARIF